MHPRIRPLTRDEVRSVDRFAIETLGIPGVVLMENAGRGLADVLEKQGILGPVAILAGKGNNGGDGFVLARHLDYRGYPVRVFHLGTLNGLPLDAATNADITRRSGIFLQAWNSDGEAETFAAQLRGFSWIVDALLGTGTRGELRDPFPALIRAVNMAEARVLAVDIPSGLDCDTGQPLGACVRADCTATFVNVKQGFLRPEAKPYLGEVHVVDIGVPRIALRDYLETSESQEA